MVESNVVVMLSLVPTSELQYHKFQTVINYFIIDSNTYQ